MHFRRVKNSSSIFFFVVGIFRTLIGIRNSLFFIRGVIVIDSRSNGIFQRSADTCKLKRTYTLCFCMTLKGLRVILQMLYFATVRTGKLNRNNSR